MDPIQIAVDVDDGPTWWAWAGFLGLLIGAMLGGWVVHGVMADMSQSELEETREEYYAEQQAVIERAEAAEAEAAEIARLSEVHEERAEDLQVEIAVMEARLERPVDLGRVPAPAEPEIPREYADRMFDLNTALADARNYAMELERLLSRKDAQIVALRRALDLRTEAHERASAALRAQTVRAEAAEQRVVSHERASRRNGWRLAGIALLSGLTVGALAGG